MRIGIRCVYGRAMCMFACVVFWKQMTYHIVNVHKDAVHNRYVFGRFVSVTFVCVCVWNFVHLKTKKIIISVTECEDKIIVISEPLST